MPISSKNADVSFKAVPLINNFPIKTSVFMLCILSATMHKILEVKWE